MSPATNASHRRNSQLPHRFVQHYAHQAVRALLVRPSHKHGNAFSKMPEFSTMCHCALHIIVFTQTHCDHWVTTNVSTSGLKTRLKALIVSVRSEKCEHPCISIMCVRFVGVVRGMNDYCATTCVEKNNYNN